MPSAWRRMLPSTTRPPRRKRLPGSSLRVGDLSLGVTKKATLSSQRRQHQAGGAADQEQRQDDQDQALVLAQAHASATRLGLGQHRRRARASAGSARDAAASAARRRRAAGGPRAASCSAAPPRVARAACRLCTNRPTSSDQRRCRTPTRHRPRSHPSPENRSSSASAPRRAAT